MLRWLFQEGSMSTSASGIDTKGFVGLLVSDHNIMKWVVSTLRICMMHVLACIQHYVTVSCSWRFAETGSNTELVQNVWKRNCVDLWMTRMTIGWILGTSDDPMWAVTRKTLCLRLWSNECGWCSKKWPVSSWEVVDITTRWCWKGSSFRW